MIVNLEETKEYLRVDFEDDDNLILSLIKQAEILCQDILRLETKEALHDYEEKLKVPILFTTAYLYENRESADYKELNLNLRNLLYAVRESKF
ncbi:MULTISPECIES: head-tail connector protein [unclassified Gemella]|uniref:head-tail connector protein n=1 Tax=unclassified Gemella TaxID=2624949 RepID=UPI0010742CA0|nr:MULTISPECIES: head-tail connector protein [unclassified Gemella]MBF0710468.1 phage gp6-like head-tail connector protein [Gemella sp. GL1.1]MBF0746590.1 phage gp6-like head-tail connector protein [Gemella sp. 19428wG2_WT2a]NYS27812.1 phage gp6-like head-tail connector protein [Gemella sp. GL1]TFU59945.1 phage gp6-like head-tail connector protein [Gemella sp. WT2a]